MLFEKIGAVVVFFFLNVNIMYLSIYFDTLFKLCTIEIHYVWSKAVLLSEFEPIQLSPSQIVPQNPLTRCCLFSQLLPEFFTFYGVRVGHFLRVCYIVD